MVSDLLYVIYLLHLSTYITTTNGLKGHGVILKAMLDFFTRAPSPTMDKFK